MKLKKTFSVICADYHLRSSFYFSLAALVTSILDLFFIDNVCLEYFPWEYSTIITSGLLIISIVFLIRSAKFLSLYNIKTNIGHKRTSNKPPKIAEFIIYLLVPRKNRDAFLGDLDEDFEEVRKKFGLRKAKFHYWFQVLRSIPPLIGESALKMVVASITKALKTSN